MTIIACQEAPACVMIRDWRINRDGPDRISRPAQKMRFLLYNIRYGVGSGASMHVPLPGAGYLIGNKGNLAKITKFIESVDADIIGLIEVDSGSIRSRRVHQAEIIAESLGMNTSYECKYGESSINQILPIVRKQGMPSSHQSAYTEKRFTILTPASSA